MKKMLFVLNPYAGTRKAAKNLAEILAVFNRAEYDVRVYVTSCQGDAIEAVKKLSDGMDLVVCSGGDGTFNETITGLMQSGCNMPVGYIPAGSTNDFASSLKLSTNIMQAARDILEGEPVAYDVGRFGDRYFSYVASFGAFAKTSYTTPQYVKNALGHTAYLLEGIQEISQLRKEHVRMELGDQVVEDDFLFGAICNSTTIGGILTLDPKRVDMADGLLEILLVRAPQNLTEITECIQAVQNQTFNCSMITYRSTSSVRVFASPDMIWTLDGECGGGHSEVDVENQHLAIRVMKRVTK